MPQLTQTTGHSRAGVRARAVGLRGSVLTTRLVPVTLAGKAKQRLSLESPCHMVADYQATGGRGVLPASLCTDEHRALAKGQGRTWRPQLGRGGAADLLTRQRSPVASCDLTRDS